jgi:hypothetical protein
MRRGVWSLALRAAGCWWRPRLLIDGGRWPRAEARRQDRQKAPGQCRRRRKDNQRKPTTRRGVAGHQRPAGNPECVRSAGAWYLMRATPDTAFRHLTSTTAGCPGMSSACRLTDLAARSTQRCRNALRRICLLDQSGRSAPAARPPARRKRSRAPAPRLPPSPPPRYQRPRQPRGKIASAPSYTFSGRSPFPRSKQRPKRRP